MHTRKHNLRDAIPSEQESNNAAMRRSIEAGIAASIGMPGELTAPSAVSVVLAGG
jgi:hypothetical protein